MSDDDDDDDGMTAGQGSKDLKKNLTASTDGGPDCKEDCQLSPAFFLPPPHVYRR